MSLKTKKLLLDGRDSGDHATVAVTVWIPATGDCAGRWVAKGSHTAMNPDTGLEAVWLDGEEVPEWALPAEEESTTDPED